MGTVHHPEHTDFCAVPQLRINGLSGQYTQVLIDSRRFQNDLDSGSLRDAGFIYGTAHASRIRFGVKLMM
jgi:hypothetical protein